MNYDISVDFMDMTNDRRLWTRVADARILSIDAEGRIELEILRGPVESHRHLLASA